MHTSIEEIDFKALAKECKSQEDLAGLSKQFMKGINCPPLSRPIHRLS